MANKNLRVSELFNLSGSPIPSTGPGTSFEMSFLDKSFSIIISGTAEIDIEGSMDDVNWQVIQTSTADASFRDQTAWKWVRANLITYTSGSVVAQVAQSEITGGTEPVINITTAAFYTVGSVAPATPTDGDVWYDTSTGEYNVYTTGVWYTLARENDVVANTLFDANSILKADSDNTPLALTVAASTFVGRKASGSIDAMTATEAKAVLNILEADISDLSHTVEVNDLTAAVTWDNVPNANITQGSVTQHVAAINHDALLNFASNEHFTEASIDHGSIGGLTGDDHTQYTLVTGARAFTGVATLATYTVGTLPAVGSGGGVIFVSDAIGPGSPQLVGSQCFSNGTNWIDVTTGAAVV